MPTPRSLGGISSQYVTTVQSPVIHQVRVENCKFSGKEYPAPKKITQRKKCRLDCRNRTSDHTMWADTVTVVCSTNWAKSSDCCDDVSGKIVQYIPHQMCHEILQLRHYWRHNKRHRKLHNNRVQQRAVPFLLKMITAPLLSKTS